MRYVMKKGKEGFTLIELMIVVAIIGILAVLAIFGVRRYLASAKTAEATNSIGAINRGSVAAWERESAPAELSVGTSVSSVHSLCSSSGIVPATPPPNKKYTANPAAGQDYQTGDQSSGWKCVRFEMSEPQYYSYAYTSAGGGAPADVSTGQVAKRATIPTGAKWLAEAAGDLNGDGTIFSNFVTGGSLISGQPITFTQIITVDDTE